MKKYFQNKSFLTGFIMFSFIFLFMVAGLIYLPYDPLKTDTSQKFLSFSSAHLLGTDLLGRDVFSRILCGLKISMAIGFTVMLSGLITGTLLGSLSGWFGGLTDKIIMKLISTQMAFPGVLLALMLSSVFNPSIKVTVFALILLSLPRFTRISRLGYIKYKNSLFVLSAKAKGAGSFRIMYYHILPNILSELLVTSTISFSMAILSESGLSYLGLGVQPPNPSFGRMIKDAQEFLFRNPSGLFGPLCFLVILVLGLNLMGDGISQVNNR